MSFRIALSALILAASLDANAHAQTRERSTAPSTAVSPPLGQWDTALDAMVARLKASYVFPDRVPVIVAALEKSRLAGRYAGISATTFAQRVTEDMSDAAHDGHLYVQFDPARFEAMKGEKTAAAGGGASLDAYYRAEALRDNNGLTDLRILPGNVRYLRVRAFQWIDDRTGLAYDDAMRFLSQGDAIVLDLRGNGGGSHAAVRYLLSHFLDPGTLLMTFMETGVQPEQSRALDHLPAGRLKGKPLFVLIDGRVASAGEDFAYAVQQFRLGELIGEKTVGAANNNRLFAIDPGFVLSVSYGRPEQAVSHTNWEGTGVAPDVPSAWSQSLDLAHSRALGRLLQSSDPASPARAEYDWAAIEVSARLAPPTPTARQLRTWAGGYGHRAEVRYRDGALWYVARAGTPQRRLTPLSGDGLFAIEASDVVRIRFATDALETYQRGDPNPRRLTRD